MNVLGRFTLFVGTLDSQTLAETARHILIAPRLFQSTGLACLPSNEVALSFGGSAVFVLSFLAAHTGDVAFVSRRHREIFFSHVCNPYMLRISSSTSANDDGEKYLR
jgi:hypothetical protein